MRILIVDDNKFDLRLAQRGLETAGVPSDRLMTAGNGKEALTLLNACDEHGKASRPDLLILDLNMPQMDGFECLEAIRSDPRFGSMPVVILTTSTHQQDIDRCYRLRCNAFHSKCSDVKVFERMVSNMVEYWSKFAKFPQI